VIFPWVSFFLGFIMAALGAYLFAGGKLYTNRAQSAASRIGKASDTSVKGYFLFGISYAVASLSCTLPIFLGLISSSLATGGVVQATGQFLAYALGMTFVITVLTIGIAVFKGAMVNQFRRVMPYVQPISAGVLILVGGYLIFYWLTEGEVSRNLGFG
jgi:cytochrome c biogenesis protein CcdA